MLFILMPTQKEIITTRNKKSHYVFWSLMILEGTTDLVDLVNDQGETRFSC